MIASVTMRRMTAADLEAVLAMEQATPQAPHWTRADYQHIVTSQAGTEGTFRYGIVAEFDGRLAGFAILRHLQLPSGYPTAKTTGESTGKSSGESTGEAIGEVESIVVAASARRRGIGGALLRAMTDFAVQGGARRLELEVRASNTAAIRLYESQGFGIEGTRPHYYSEPDEAAVLMGKNLGSE